MSNAIHLTSEQYKQLSRKAQISKVQMPTARKVERVECRKVELKPCGATVVKNEMTIKEYQRLNKRGAFAVKRAKNVPKRRRSPFGVVGSPNKTEARYNAEMLNGRGAYEPLSLKLPGGSRYTPDFVTWDEQGRMTCHEVKGSFRFASESRAVAVVRECAHHFPHITFVWATLEKGGEWSVFKANEGGADATFTGTAESERK